MDSIHQHVLRDGYATVADVLGPPEVDTLLRAVARLPQDGESRGGHRDLFQLPEVRELAVHPAIHRWPRTILGPQAFAVRAILFDKTPSANWKVAWHQDLTIPTKAAVATVGFGPWSEKAGIPHVQPPAGVLERMLTVRVHLDPCGLANGPVRVLPGSHTSGKLSGADIDAWKERAPAVDTPVGVGGLLLMRPLILHASSAATHPGRRRVIHLEYAADPLPEGLAWFERYPNPVDSAA
jgi:ectoine hydroxylase-related dioxygenase (phytanoyl-CoA dioxygenase family)